MNPVSPQAGRHEEGFLLLGVLFMILLILFALAVAAPKMAEQVRRDKETETMHRGLQYARAIRVFYSKYGRYPSTIDELVKTQDQRFLRKRYLNPMTGKDDWRIIHLGEAKVGPVGLFGASAPVGGITPTGASTGASSSLGSSLGSAGSGGPTFGGGSSSLGSSGSGFGSSSNSGFGGNSGSGFGNSGSSSSTSSTSSSTSTTGGTDPGSSGGIGSSTPIGGTTTTGQTSGSAFGSPGVSVGGAPIVGVGLLSKKESIKVYKKQTHYYQWEFVFDPNQSALEATAGAGTSIPGAGNGTGVNGTSGSGLGGSGINGTSGSGLGGNSNSGFGTSTGSGFGSSNGSGFGSSGGSGFGGTPASPVNPTSPVSNSNQ